MGALAVASVAAVSVLTSCSLHFLATLAAAGGILFEALLLLVTEQFMLKEGMTDHQDFYIPRWVMGLSWSVAAVVAAAAALGAGAGPSMAATAGMCSAAVCGAVSFIFRDRVWAMTGRLLPGIFQAAATMMTWIARRPGPDAWGGYSLHVLCLLIAYIAYDIISTERRMAALQRLLQPPQQEQKPVGGP